MTSSLHPLTRAQSSLIGRLLRDSHTRSLERAFVVEGAKFCWDLLRQHPDAVSYLVVSPGYLEREEPAVRAMRSAAPVAQYLCADEMFRRLSEVEAPQGILAIVKQPQWSESQVWDADRVLGLYGVQLRDPANVGAIIRTAAALNLTALWLSSDSADHFAPKVVRSAAASLFSLPIFVTDDVGTFSLHECAIYSAVPPSTGAVSLQTIRERPRRAVLAFGNEGQGLPLPLVKASGMPFTIPIARGVESLNVAATVAISAFYFSELPVARSD